MSRLPNLNRVALKTGIIVNSGGTLVCNVNGSLVPLRRFSDYTPTLGDVVAVYVVDGTFLILGKTTAAAVGAPTGGGDSVAPTPAPAPPRSPAETGMTTVAALASGSYRPAYSKWEPGDVKQGAYGGGAEYQGAWFYSATSLKALSGRTCTRLRIRVGSRLRIGSFNSSLAFQFHRHSSTSPTGGAHTVTDGPDAHTVGAGSGALWIDLPAAWGQTLVTSGGGIAIRGGSYGGFTGRSADPASGQLQIFWRM